MALPGAGSQAGGRWTCFQQEREVGSSAAHRGPGLREGGCSLSPLSPPQCECLPDRRCRRAGPESQGRGAVGAGARHGGGSPLSPVFRLGHRRRSPGPPSLHSGCAQNCLPEAWAPRQQQSPEGHPSLSDEDEAWAPGARVPWDAGDRRGCQLPATRTLSWGPTPADDPSPATAGPLTRPRSEWPGVWNSAALPGLLRGPPRGRARAVGGEGRGN